MASYEACKAAAQLASQGKGSGTEDTISLDVHSINQLKVGPLFIYFVIQYLTSILKIQNRYISIYKYFFLKSLVLLS